MTQSYRIGVIAGDGIGPEVIAEGRRVLDHLARREGFGVTFVDFDLGAKICVVACDNDDDCAGGTCLGEGGAKRCYGGFSGTACPVTAQPPEGCGCSAATASSSSSSSLAGALALVGLGGALLRRRRRA